MTLCSKYLQPAPPATTLHKMELHKNALHENDFHEIDLHETDLHEIRQKMNRWEMLVARKKPLFTYACPTYYDQAVFTSPDCCRSIALRLMFPTTTPDQHPI